jgi:diguanylate cyclase (GGDEF)-like protein/PAS domain S-box-containing protein
MQPVIDLVPRALRGIFRRKFSFSSSLQFGAIAFVLLVCLCVVGTEAVNIWGQRAQAVQDAWEEAGNLARSLGQQAEDMARIADLSILGAIQRLELDGTTTETVEKLHQIMVARVKAFPALAGFVIADETGKCLSLELTKMPEPCSVAGRADFEYHQSHDSKGARLSPPVRSIGSGVWVIPLSRRFNHPDGSFAGIVMTGISIPYLQSYYDTFNIGPNGAILLASGGDDPLLLVRRPFVEANIGRSLRTGGVFRAMAEKGPVGNLELRSATDGIWRLNSYRRLDAYPLIVAVGFATDDALHDWRANARFDILMTLGLITVIGAFGAWLAQHIRARRRLEDAYREAATAFRLLAENSTDLIVRLGPNNERLYVSPACRALLGYESEELMGQSPLEIVHPDDRERWAEHYGPADAGSGEDIAAIYRVIRKDGLMIWIEGSRRRLAADAGFVVSIRDVTRRKEAEDLLEDANRQLQWMANQDGLTSLANRRHFDDTLEAEFRRATRDGSTLSLIMIDVDHFKTFNDRYGHPAGDRCLQEIAAALSDIPHRPGDLVARYGGEEMAIILPNTPLQGALMIAERARCLIGALGIRHDGNVGRIVTISLGVASLTAGITFDGPVRLIEAADRALYAAKKAGRDAVYPPPQAEIEWALP